MSSNMKQARFKRLRQSKYVQRKNCGDSVVLFNEDELSFPKSFKDKRAITSGPSNWDAWQIIVVTLKEYDQSKMSWLMIGSLWACGSSLLNQLLSRFITNLTLDWIDSTVTKMLNQRTKWLTRLTVQPDVGKTNLGSGTIALLPISLTHLCLKSEKFELRHLAFLSGSAFLKVLDVTCLLHANLKNPQDFFSTFIALQTLAIHALNFNFDTHDALLHNLMKSLPDSLTRLIVPRLTFDAPQSSLVLRRLTSLKALAIYNWLDNQNQMADILPQLQYLSTHFCLLDQVHLPKNLQWYQWVYHHKPQMSRYELFKTLPTTLTTVVGVNTDFYIPIFAPPTGQLAIKIGASPIRHMKLKTGWASRFSQQLTDDMGECLESLHVINQSAFCLNRFSCFSRLKNLKIDKLSADFKGRHKWTMDASLLPSLLESFYVCICSDTTSFTSSSIVNPLDSVVILDLADLKRLVKLKSLSCALQLIIARNTQSFSTHILFDAIDSNLDSFQFNERSKTEQIFAGLQCIIKYDDETQIFDDSNHICARRNALTRKFERTGHKNDIYCLHKSQCGLSEALRLRPFDTSKSLCYL